MNLRHCFVILATLTLCACATFGERESEPAEPVDPTDPAVSAGERIHERQQQEDGLILDEEEEPDEESFFSETEVFPGTGDFIDVEAASRRYAPVPEDGEISFNFEAQGIQQVVHAILGHMLQENYVIAPGVAGEVTFATARPIRRDQVMSTLEMLLSWTGNTLVWRDDRYYVVPVSEATRGNVPRVATTGGQQRGFEVVAVPLQYISPGKMAELLEPYVGEGAIVNADNARSILFLGGVTSDLRNYLQIVDTFDVDWMAGMSIGIFTLQFVDLEDITTELETVFGEEGETPMAGMFRFLPLERLNAVMVITPREHFLQEAEKWIKRLDRASPGAGARLYVYRVKNLEADVLAGYLGDIFGSSGGRQPRRERRGALAPGLERAQVGSASDLGRRQEEGQQQQSRTTEGGLTLGGDGDVRITAVQETNSLLIQSTPQQYEAILSAIEKLDEEPLQVLIEVQVLDVVLNDTLRYGVQWFLANRAPEFESGGEDDDGNPIPPVTASRDDDVWNLGGAGGFLGTITRRAVGRTFVRATIDALETVSDIRTISSPSLLIRNNAEANINVGEQLPVQSTRFVSGNTANNTIGNVSYINTGTILDVVPRVNPGGLVYLQIRQEVSTPGDPGVGENPTVNTRVISTDVAVQSGESIILGGLIREDTTDSRRGVPFLQRLPILGSFFRTTTKSTNRSEIIVLLTPTVVDSADRLREVSDEFRKKFKGLEPLRESSVD